MKSSIQVHERIYLSPPHLGGLEFEYVHDAIASNWIAPLGPHVEAFEREFADRVGVQDAAAISSGTAALHLALHMVGVGPGDSVICSTFTFAATAFAIRYLGAVPIFIDSEERTWNMDPALLEDEIQYLLADGQRPKAVLVVDLYGQCADWNPIREICNRYDIPVIEDAAEALGATYMGAQAGSLAPMAAFSFNGNKIITTSGGGMLVSDDLEVIQRARYLASQARMPVAHYEHTEIGFNYRMSNLLAAVGRAQLASLDNKLEIRRKIFEAYKNALGRIDGLQFMPTADFGQTNHWLTCITLDAERIRFTPEEIRLELETKNIESRPVWKPLHLQPVFQASRIRGGGVSERIFASGLCLPSGSGMTSDQQERVIEAVIGLLG